MPPDFGTYIALSASPDIAAKRNYDIQNQQYAQQLAQFSEYQAQQKSSALNQIGDYFGAVDQQINELLPEDMKRVQGVWDNKKQAVIDKLKEYGNDPQMFMRMGGATVVKKFANDFYRSPEMQNAINTKENLTAGLKDMSNPELELRNVSWTDKNGETQTGDLATWTKAHQNGDAVDLHYNGAYKKPSIDPLEFAKIPNGGKPVTHSQLFDYTVLKGLAPADAADYLSKAAPHIMDPKNPNNTVFNWGRDPNNTSSERLAWDQWKYDHPQAKPEKETQYIADNLYDILKNPARWKTDSSYKGTPYQVTDAFKGMVMKGTGQNEKDLNRKVVYLARFPNDPNMYPLFEDQTKQGKFIPADAKKNAPIDPKNLYETFMIPAYNGTYGTGADGKIEKTRDYATSADAPADMAATLGIPSFSGGAVNTGTQQPPSQETQTIGGKTYIKVNGNWYER